MIKIKAKCSCCGKEGTYEMNIEEYATHQRYWCYGRQMGYIQNRFTNVTPWSRREAIDLYSDGFCICPDC